MSNSKPVKEWKPGQSGNLNGRPKDSDSGIGILREIGDQKEIDIKLTGFDGEEKRILIQPEKGDLKRALMTMLYAKGLSGNLNAIKMILNRVYGKPREMIEIVGKNQEGMDYDLSKFSDEELKTFLKLMEKSKPKMIEGKNE